MEEKKSISNNFNSSFNFDYFKLNGDWGLGIGDWGLGIGDWAQSPIPNPQSPIPKNNDPYMIELKGLKIQKTI